MAVLTPALTVDLRAPLTALFLAAPVTPSLRALLTLPPELRKYLWTYMYETERNSYVTLWSYMYETEKQILTYVAILY